MVNAADVSAVLVTRGNVDMEPIIASLPFPDVIVWDNSKETDRGVYGRYAAISDASADVIYVQDDDVILPPESIAALLAAYEPGKITANMPEGFRAHYTDSCLIGFGAVFDQVLPGQSFWKFYVTQKPVPGVKINDRPFVKDYLRWAEMKTPEFAEMAGRTCDVIFTTLTQQVWVDVPYVEREFARDPDRMYRQPEHYGERQRMLELARQVRDRVPA